MNEATLKEWVENNVGGEPREQVEHPIDAWIELALYTDEPAIRLFFEIVGDAIKRMKWELENVPTKWVHVRERKIMQLSYWVAIQDKLRSLSVALDDIPF